MDDDTTPAAGAGGEENPWWWLGFDDGRVVVSQAPNAETAYMASRQAGVGHAAKVTRYRITRTPPAERFRGRVLSPAEVFEAERGTLDPASPSHWRALEAGAGAGPVAARAEIVWLVLDRYEDIDGFAHRSFETARERARGLARASIGDDGDGGEPTLSEVLAAIDSWTEDGDGPREVVYRRHPRGAIGPWTLALVSAEMEP